jgi:hypothetical protein
MKAGSIHVRQPKRCEYSSTEMRRPERGVRSKREAPYYVGIEEKESRTNKTASSLTRASCRSEALERDGRSKGRAKDGQRAAPIPQVSQV